jgi:hypothetical protein
MTCTLTLPYPPSVNSMYIDEQWSPLAISGRCYAVSSMGRFKRLDQSIKKSNGVVNHFTERMMKPVYPANGRAHVAVRGRSIILSNLVAQAFIGERPRGYVVSHKDGDKTNDKASNLEYTTASRNGLNIADRMRSNNTSGIRGVHDSTKSLDGRWIGYIYFDRRECRYSSKNKMHVVAWRKIMELLVGADRRSA